MKRSATPYYGPRFYTCRFCKESDHHENLLRYSTRCHAHTMCFYNAKGLGGLFGLRVAAQGKVQVMRLPKEARRAFMDHCQRAFEQRLAR